MKKILFCLLPGLLAAGGLKAQDSSLHQPAPFIEAGIGLFFNADAPSIERSSYLYRYYKPFSKGADLDLHFGMPVYHGLGISARYKKGLAMVPKHAIQRDFAKAFPDDNLSVSSPAWTFSGLQIGIYKTAVYHNLDISLEFLAGYGSYTLPFLLVEGKNKTHPEQEDVLILRKSQYIPTICFTPAVSVNWHFRGNSYWFARAEMFIGFPSTDNTVYAFPDTLNWDLNNAGYTEYFPTLTLGYGWRLGR